MYNTVLLLEGMVELAAQDYARYVRLKLKRVRLDTLDKPKLYAHKCIIKNGLSAKKFLENLSVHTKFFDDAFGEGIIEEIEKRRGMILYVKNVNGGGHKCNTTKQKKG